MTKRKASLLNVTNSFKLIPKGFLNIVKYIIFFFNLSDQLFLLKTFIKLLPLLFLLVNDPDIA